MKEEIKEFFKGDAEDDEETLVKYSRDASIFIVRPKIVLFPKDTEDVQNLVKWVNKVSARQDLAEKYEKLSITCRCAGTDMSGGAINESIILDFTRYMNKMVSFSSLENFITVQPGMFYRDFEKITLEKGLILPCYTASKSLNAMGGMFGNNSAGERTLKYGKTEDYILEAKIILADGNEYVVKSLSEEELQKKIEEKTFEGGVYKNIYELIKNNEEIIKNAKPNVHKNSAGYYIWNVIAEHSEAIIPRQVEGLISKNLKDLGAFALGDIGQGTHDAKNLSNFSPKIFDLNKLLVGSQGTLGIVTEITFKLVKNYKYSKLVVIFMKDLAPLGSLVDEILTLNPETLETYDDKTLKLAVRFFPDFLKNKGLLGMIKFMWSFLPEFFMTVFSGLPKMILLAEFAGENEEEVDMQCLKLKEKISNFELKVHITKSETEANKYWDIRRESFSLLRKHIKDLHTAPFIDDIIVRPEFLSKFIPELNQILKKYDLVYTIAGHAGDGNFHIIPLMDFSSPDTANIIMELSEKVYDLVVKYHGSITAEHNDGIIRTPFLEKMYGDKVIGIFKQIKQIFDPQNIFNPGKKIAVENSIGTKEYISSHIALEHHSPHAS